jgi:DNA (cytosine-5)-methyltransferase 1
MEWKYTNENPLRVVTLCSGYDSQLMAIRNLGIPYECVGWSEIDKYAIKAHDAVFPEIADRNLGDMTKIDWGKVGDFDLLFYSTPCTDFSNAGKQAGGEEGSGTRSSILWFTRNAIIEKRPKYLVMENVKALVSEKFRPLFLKWCDELTGYGYTNFMQVLNAKDYGVPQNRERIFVVSILGDAWFTFPQPRELKLRLKDLLEDKVDEKYYLPQEKVNQFIESLDDEKLKLIEKDSDQHR